MRLPAQRVQGSFRGVVWPPTGHTTDSSPRRHENHSSARRSQRWERCSECGNQREKVDVKVRFPSRQGYALARDGAKWFKHTGVQHQTVKSIMGFDKSRDHVCQCGLVRTEPDDGQEVSCASGESTDISHWYVMRDPPCACSS